MGALFILCAIFVGLAVYRSGEARARWQSLRASRTTVRNQRNTAWRHTGSSALYVVVAIFLLFIVLKLFK
jgi:type IV secretory pathway component VirB8